MCPPAIILPNEPVEDDEPLIVPLYSKPLVNEPLISLAICADELTTEPSASPSSLVILDAKLELTDVNEPLILAATKSASASSAVSLEAKLELTDVNEPLIFVPRVEPNSVASKRENEPVEVDEPLIFPDTSKLPVITQLPV
jgi:hypothetical protein